LGLDIDDKYIFDTTGMTPEEVRKNNSTYNSVVGSRQIDFNTFRMNVLNEVKKKGWGEL